MKEKSCLLVAMGASLLLSASLVAAQDISDGIDTVSVETIRSELESVPLESRRLMSRQQMSLFAENALFDRRLARAAVAAGVPKKPEVMAQIERATRDVIVRAFINDEVAKYAAGMPDLSGLARERYLLKPGVYIIPEAIRASHILFAVNDKEAGKDEAAALVNAVAVLKQLREGADFAVLAKEHSDDKGSKRRGGELGDWAGKGKFVPQFEAAAFALKPGEISEPVRTKYGYHIIRLTEKRAARQPVFEEVKDRVIADLRKELVSEHRAMLLRSFRAQRALELSEETWLGLQKW